MNITRETERAVYGAESPNGLTRREGDDERRVDVPIVVVATDRRVLFVSADPAHRDGGVDAGALAYADLAAVAVAGDRVELTTTDGVEWVVDLPSDAAGSVDALVRHLDWIGSVREQVRACGANVGDAVDEIQWHVDATDWDPASAVYDETRATLDAAILAVQLVGPIQDAVLAPRLTELERSLEAAYAESLLARAESRLSLGQQLIEEEVYDRACVLLEGAREDYRVADEHATAVERGDAFQFGQQRTIHDRLERLDWEIEAVAAAPLRRAYEAKAGAQSADEATAKVERWERAFRRFGRVLAQLTDEEDPAFSGDPAVLREEAVDAAGQLVAIHRTMARVEWDEGVDRATADENRSAVRRFGAGIEHAERAVGLAERFRPEAAAEMEPLVERMRSARDRFRDTRDSTAVVSTEALKGDGWADDEVREETEDKDVRAAGDEPTGQDGRRREMLAAGDSEGLDREEEG